VVTGHVGPKAFATLQAGGVKVYTGAAGPAGAEADSAETLTVAEAIEQFKQPINQSTSQLINQSTNHRRQ